MLRILIADDHPVIRQGIIHLLRTDPSFAPPAEAATRAETLAQVEAYQPDLVVMNTTLVDANSLEVLITLKRLQPALRIILLHPEPDPDFTRRALECGADGIVTKLEPDEELLAAIRAVTRREVYISTATAILMGGGSAPSPT
jgi:DNA-binding NarL/FixJ family response regulator